MQPESLPQPPFHAITLHRPAHRPGYGKADARAGRIRRTPVRQAERRKKRAGDAQTLVIDEPELRRAQNPQRSRESARTGRRDAHNRLAGFGVSDGSFVADRQLVAAASAPPGEHRPAILALHARAKTMRLGALAVVRLKCSLWHCFCWRASAPGLLIEVDAFSIAGTTLAHHNTRSKASQKKYSPHMTLSSTPNPLWMW